jgi:hypothetical protein
LLGQLDRHQGVSERSEGIGYLARVIIDAQDRRSI